MTLTVALGSFDGIHLGHREVIQTAADAGPATVLCFEPVPRQFFEGHLSPLRLTTPMERLELLRGMDVEMMVWPFDSLTAEMDPESFLDLALDELRGLGGCRRIVAGYDFHFGRGRSGGPDQLRDWCRQRGVEAVIVGSVQMDGSPVKSRRIRNMIRMGDTTGAAALLGRDYSVRGPVSRGRGHGRRLGFRTLNLRTPASKLLPAAGSYAARITVSEHVWDGVAFVPAESRSLVEVHVPGFDGLPYGVVVEAVLGPFVAPPQEDLEESELKAKIATEVDRAMEVCSRWR